MSALVEAAPRRRVAGGVRRTQPELRRGHASTRCRRWACCRNCARRPAPIRRIHVSRSGDFGRVRLDAADYGREAFGQVVVARDFGAGAGSTTAMRSRDLTRYRPARFVGLGDVDDGRAPGAHRRRGRRARARRRSCWSAPTARAAACAHALGIGADEHDYGQTLFVARVRARTRAGRHRLRALRRRRPDRAAAARRSPFRRGAWRRRRARPTRSPRSTTPRSSRACSSAFGWRAGRLRRSARAAAYPAIPRARRAHHRDARGAGRQCRADLASRSARRDSTSACAMR